MNILILNWKDIKNPSSGGAELVTFEHAKRWVEKGHNVVWLASSFNDAKKSEIIDGVRIERFGNIYSIYLYAPFFYFFSKNKFDLVIDEVHGIPFFTPLYVRLPVIVLIHEIAGEIWDYMYPFPVNLLGKTLEKIYLKLYKRKRFWTDANSTITELKLSGIKTENCISIACPSNLNVISKPMVKNNEITFVCVSRLVKMKGIEDVLKAYFLISKKIINSKLIIIGNGDIDYVNFLKKEVELTYKLKDKVLFKGYVSEIEKTDILKKSHLLLHASVKEGWGIVVIEAASQSTPSVVYDVPGLNESVKNGVTGIVLKNNSPEKMANEAINLISAKITYRKYQENCLKWARSLNWESASAQSLSLIESVIKNKK